MLNYCIFITLWSAWIVLGAAASLSGKLGKAFRQPLPREEELPPPIPGEARQRVLSYASPVKPSVIRKRPWLAGLATLLEVIALLPLLALPIAVWLVGGWLEPYAHIAIAYVLVTLTAFGWMMVRGLRQIDGTPAAVNWPHRKLQKLRFAGIAVLVLVLIVLDLLTGFRMRAIELNSRSQAAQFHIAVPANSRNAADLYRDAFGAVSTVPDWISRYAPGDNAPTAPPALSAELQKAVPILHEASTLPVAEWGPDPITTLPQAPFALMPHIALLRSSATLLNVHAAGEAQAGRLESAIRDIQVLRRMAHHTQQGSTLVAGLTGMGMEALSYRSTEDLLPFVQDEQLLATLYLPPDESQRALRIRMLHSEQAYDLCLMSSTYQSTGRSKDQ